MSFVAKNLSLLSKILLYKAKMAVKPRRKERYRAKVAQCRSRMLKTFPREELERACHNTPARVDGRASLPCLGEAPTTRKKARVLILGRLKEGDSIAVHTTAFLKSLDASAMDVHLYNEYDRTLYIVKNSNEFEEIGKCNITSYDASAYDILLFLNVLCHGHDRFEDKVPCKKAFLSYAYAVFDGTVPPAGWANAINAYFDALLVPVDSLRGIFARNGVVKPIFTLPVLLDLGEYFACKSTPRDSFTFGWIGVAEDRKNVLKIISAFQRAFPEASGVRLHLHTRFIDKRTDEGWAFARLMGHLPSNISITHECLAKEELVALMRSFDAYVYVSKGEGFSVTPRCALACGQPVILSAIHAHRDICNLGEEDGVFWVQARKEIPAVQPSLNGQVCGSMFDIEEGDLVDAFARLYQRREELREAARADKRRKAVEQYHAGTVGFLYRQLLLPSRVALAADDSIESDHISTTSLTLCAKYQRYLKNIAYTLTICPGHDGGFCSLFNKYMSHLVYAGENELVLPDWQFSTIAADVFKRTGQMAFESFCYGNKEDGNIFLRLFGNPFEGKIDGDILESDLMYSYADTVLDSFDFNHRREPNLTYLNSYKLYADETYFKEFRRKYHIAYKKFIRLDSALKAAIDEFHAGKVGGRLLISALVRCSAHALELLENDKPTFEKYERHILDILNRHGIAPESDGWRLFLATDNELAKNHFSSRFGRNAVTQDMQRLTEAQEQEYQRIQQEGGRHVPGYELQHRDANDKARRSVQRAREILFDVHMLARARYCIFINSNISTMASYINPDMEMIYCQ